MRHAFITGVIVIAASACGGATMFPADYPGSAQSRRTGWAMEEGPPAETTGDELVLSYQDEHSVCFDATFRAELSLDVPLDGESITGTDKSSSATDTAALSSERVSVYDYDESGHVHDVVTEGITAAAYAEASHDPPGPGLTRIIERSARLCFELPASTAIFVYTNGIGGGRVEFLWEG